MRHQQAPDILRVGKQPLRQSQQSDFGTHSIVLSNERKKAIVAHPSIIKARYRIAPVGKLRRGASNGTITISRDLHPIALIDVCYRACRRLSAGPDVGCFPGPLPKADGSLTADIQHRIPLVPAIN